LPDPSIYTWGSVRRGALEQLSKPSFWQKTSSFGAIDM
jgi:hypothetical protein